MKGKKRSKACLSALIFLDLVYLGGGKGESKQLNPSLLANASFVPEIQEKPDLDYWAL